MKSEWISIATLPKVDFSEAMSTLFKEVDQNGNVQQLVAYSTVKAISERRDLIRQGVMKG